MKVYTVLTHRDSDGLTKFVQTARDIGATGVTIFTRPEMVYPTIPEGMETEESLQKKMDVAATRKDYKEATLMQQKIEALKTIRSDLAKEGCKWIADIVEPIKEITQLVVLGNLHWPAADAFTQKAFMSKIEPISNVLTTTGIGGIKQPTPLHQRTFIPLPGDTGGYGVQGEPATGPGSSSPPFETTPLPATPQIKPPKNKRDASLPRALSEKQAEYAKYRLGLDRGGQRRSRNEAGNMLGYSPAIAVKIENSIGSVWKEFQGIIASSDVLA